MNRQTLSILLLLLLVNGCEKQTGGAIDPTGQPPLINQAMVKPDSIRMTTLPQSNGILAVSIEGQVRVTDPAGTANISGVTVDVIPTGQSDPLATFILHDDGISPDSASGDGVFSALIQFTIPRSASGAYLLRFNATNRQGFSSSTIIQPLLFIRDSHAPLLSNLVAPDTVRVPSGGSATIEMTIRATDPDGQLDIREVYWRSLDSQNPDFMYRMLNDGSAPGSVPGDSNYAFSLHVQDTQSSPIVHKTFRFAFQAVNNFGDTSATILHRITIP